MSTHESRRLAPKSISRVVHLFHRFGPTEDAARVEVTMSTAEEAEELSETPARRGLLGLRTQVPLADHPRGVAGGGQSLRQQRLRQRQAVIAVRIVFMAKTVLLTPRQ